MSVANKLSQYVIKKTTNAEEVYRGINGIFCIYKPAGKSRPQIKRTLLNHICRG